MNELILGAECKVKVTLPKIDETNPYGYDFDVELYTNPKKRCVIKKYGCFPVEGKENEFIVPFDSSAVGVGDMNVEIVVYVPDAYFADGLRTERIRIESVATIIP